jgi:TonB family protein
MRSSLIPLLALQILTAQAGPAAQTPARLVFEGDTRPHFSRTSQYVELRSGRGRLRVAQVLSDFTMTCEFRIDDENARGEILLKGWATGEVRIHLPPVQGTLPQNLVEGRGTHLLVRSLGPITPSAPNVWHRLNLQVAGRELVLSINGVETGRYEITEFAGHVAFAVSRGRIQLRSIYPLQMAPAAPVEPVYPVTDQSLTGPALLREVKPDYTAEAMRGKIEGIVALEAIVEPDGRVGAVRVIRAIDPGLDQKAIEAVRQWRFKPGSREGRAVPVLVNIELTFKIK